MPKDLDLGVLFTGDATAVVRACQQIQVAIDKLNAATAKFSRTSKSSTANYAAMGSDITAFQNFVGNLNSRLEHGTTLYRKANEAVTALSSKYGKASIDLEGWGKELNKQVGIVNRVSQAMRSVGKSSDAYLKSINLAAQTEFAWMTRSGESANIMRVLGPEIAKVTGAQIAYQKAVLGSTHRGKAFNDALEMGYVKYRDNADMFNQYYKSLKQYTIENDKALQSTNAAVSSQAKAKTAINLSTGALEKMEPTVKSVADAQITTSSAAERFMKNLNPLQKALYNARNESFRYRTALVELYGMKTHGTVVFNKWEKALNQANSIVAELGEKMLLSGRRGDIFRKNVDLMSVAQDIFAGRITSSSKGLKKHSDDLSTASRQVLAADKKYGTLLDTVTRTDTVFTKFGKTLKSMAYWGTAATLIYGAIEVMRNGISTVIDFDQALKNLQAITTATAAETAVMGDTIKKLAKDSKYSTDEIAGGMVYLGQAGLSAAESIDTIKAVTLLAGGTLEDINKTADLLTTTMKAYNLTSSDSSHIADVMASAINKSKLSVEHLRVAFGYVAPVASEAGISLEETATATMLLADAGLRASTIGTSFRQVIARLISPTEALKAKFNKMGADISKLDPSTNSLKDVLEELARIAPKAGDAFSLFGLRGAPAVVVLTRAVNEADGAYQKAYESVYQLGSAQEMFDIQMTGLGSRLANLVSNVKLFTLSLGDTGLGAALGLVIDMLNGTTKAMTAFMGSGLSSYITSIGAATIAVYGIARAFTYLYEVIKVTAFAESVRAIWYQLVVRDGGLVAALVQSKSALISLGKVILGHPILLFSTIIGTATVMAYKFATGIKASVFENQKLAIEEAKHVIKLREYKAILTNTSEKSLEHKNKVRELAHEYPELGTQIDVINGRFYNLQEGIKSLDDYIETRHKNKLADESKALIGLANATLLSASDYEFSIGSLLGWYGKYSENIEQLKTQLRSMIPIFTQMGLSASSSMEEINTALSKNLKDASPEIVSQISTALKAVFDKIAQDQKARIDEEKALYDKGLLKDIPTTYINMYKDIQGIRKADADKLFDQLNKNLASIKENVSDTEEEIEASEAQKVKLHLEATKKIADATRQVGETQTDVDNAIMANIERVGNASLAQYNNEIIRIEAQKQRELDAAGVDLAKRKEVENQYEIKRKAVETRIRAFVLALRSITYDELRTQDQNYVEWYRRLFEKLGADANSLLTISPKIPEGLTPKEMYRDSEAEMKDWENNAQDFINRVSWFAKEWADILRRDWGSASNYQKSLMIKMFKESQSTMEGLSANTEAAKEELSNALRSKYDAVLQQVNEGANRIHDARIREIDDQLRLYKIESDNLQDKNRKAELEAQRELLQLEKYRLERKASLKADAVTLSAMGKVQTTPSGLSLDYKSPTTNFSYINRMAGDFAGVISSAVEVAAAKYNIDPAWIYAIIDREADKTGGTYNPKSRNYVGPGHFGIGQFKLSTARDVLKYMKMDQFLNIPDEELISVLFDPAMNSTMIAAYLRKRLDELGGNVRAVIGEYIGTTGPVYTEAEIEKLRTTMKEHYGIERDYNYSVADVERNVAQQRINIAKNLEETKRKNFEQEQKRIQAQVNAQVEAIEKELAAKKALADGDAALNTIRARENDATLQDMLDSEVEYNRARYNEIVEAIERVKSKLGENPAYADDLKIALGRLYKQQMDYQEKVITSEQAAFDERSSNIEYFYRTGKISAQEYYDYLIAQSQRPISESEIREWLERITTEFGSFADQIALGFERARAKAKSFGQVVVEITEEVPEQLSSGFTSAFREFAEGTKTAGQAFQDFARDVLWWLAELIIKQTLYNALVKGVDIIGGLLGGGGGGASYTMWAIDKVGTPGLHSGGIVGLDSPTFTRNIMASAFADAQRMHSGGISGVRSDEQTAILKKGEGVFTEAQMAALSPGGAQSVSITNITDPRVIDAYLATTAGKKSILNVIGANAFAVKRILRNTA